MTLLQYQHRIEGILRCFEVLHLMAYTYDRYDIKAQFLIHLMLLDISIGGYCQITHLFCHQRLPQAVGLSSPERVFTSTTNQGLSIWRKRKDIQVTLTFFQSGQMIT